MKPADETVLLLVCGEASFEAPAGFWEREWAGCEEALEAIAKAVETGCGTAETPKGKMTWTRKGG